MELILVVYSTLGL